MSMPCTKIAYPDRWTAARILKRLQAAGRGERSLYPCRTCHGQWHLTSAAPNDWLARFNREQQT